MIVIPMAGFSRRFREAGYGVPKYRLLLHGRSLFAHAVASFKFYFASESFLFVARDEPGISAFIDDEVKALGVVNWRVVLLPGATLGQADTVRLGLDAARVSPETPLTIFNIDTFRPGFRYPDVPWMATADGYLEVMNSDDPGFSFVQRAASEDDRVSATAEKKVISNLASTGLYWFRRSSFFMDSIESAKAEAGELFVAPLYNVLIQRGLDIRFFEIQSKDVIFCGVPSQFETLLSQAVN